MPQELYDVIYHNVKKTKYNIEEMVPKLVIALKVSEHIAKLILECDRPAPIKKNTNIETALRIWNVMNSLNLQCRITIASKKGELYKRRKGERRLANNDRRAVPRGKALYFDRRRKDRRSARPKT